MSNTLATKKTVFVGLSGGVDSSVAALRLKQRGFEVVGVFIKVWHPEWMVCNWEQERLDAMRVAAHLEIPFLTCDAADTYRDDVAQYFIEAYRSGRTPNPDVMCNQKVKFGAFLQFARERGAAFIATGHYAQKWTDDAGVHHLIRGVDSNKDQSYFLWTLTQAQLEHVLLPVGDTMKEAVRLEAAAAGIPTASKKDSQGICFLGHVDIPEFLGHYIDLEPGDVLDESGVVVGQHRGAFVYTLGQRHGFTLNTEDEHRSPRYVVAKDVSANTVTVSPAPPLHPQQERLELTSANPIEPLVEGEVVEAQFRYRQAPFNVQVERVDPRGCVTLVPETEAERPAPGQSCVLYRGERCLGGGIIA